MSEPQAEERGKQRRALLWLTAGAIVGIGFGAFGLLAGAAGGRGLPDGAAASVNGNFIARDGYERLVSGLDADTRQPITPELRVRVLERMIDEELLVQRGLELGLARSDRRVRANITTAMIRSVVLEAEDTPPTEDDLIEFYESDSAFFRQPGRVRVGQVFFRVPAPSLDDQARGRAAVARDRLRAGDALETVRQENGDREISPVPDAMLPPAKLREYVGPTALRAAMELGDGEVREPVRSGTGYHVFVLKERARERVPPFDEIRKQVRAEWVRRAGDNALRAYLDGLRRDADVVVAEDLE